MKLIKKSPEYKKAYKKLCTSSIRANNISKFINTLLMIESQLLIPDLFKTHGYFNKFVDRISNFN